MFLNIQQVTEEIKREIKTFLETNDNEKMTTQNLWDATKAIQEGGFQQYSLTSRNKKKISKAFTYIYINNMYYTFEKTYKFLSKKFMRFLFHSFDLV